MSINNITLTGRLVSNPTTRQTQSGKVVANISIAVNRKFKKDEVDFFECTAWEKTAEIVGEYLRKGSQVGILGNLRQDTFEIDGKKRSKVGITIEQIEFLDTKGNKSDNSNDSSDDFPFD